MTAGHYMGIALVIFCLGVVLGSAAWRAKRFSPPCGYGAVPIIVVEQDGEPRRVCGCPR